MHILLANDDGIHAAGIHALCRQARQEGHRVSICAPDRERSAASHGISLTRSLHPEKMTIPGAERAWSLDGTPADCARMGLFLCQTDPVDMVISGINRGPNLGGACVYSGTVASALEASMSGVPALAVSLCINGDGSENYLPASRLALRVANWMSAHPLPRGAIYSLNVPALPYERIRGVVAAKLAPLYLDEPNYRMTDEGYRYADGLFPTMDDPEYDINRIAEGFATLTSLTWNMCLETHEPETGDLQI